MKKLTFPVIFFGAVFSVSYSAWAYQINTTGILGFDLKVVDSTNSLLGLSEKSTSFVYRTDAAVDAEANLWGVNYEQAALYHYDYETSMFIEMTGGGSNRQYIETSGNIALPQFSSSQVLTFELWNLDWSLMSVYDSIGADLFGRYLGFSINVFAYANTSNEVISLGQRESIQLSSEIFDADDLDSSVTLVDAYYYPRTDPDELFRKFEVAIALDDNAFGDYTYGFTISTFMEHSVEAADTPIPEPSTFLLLGVGFLGFQGVRRRVSAHR